jgi:hypothetical protein
MRKTAKTNPEFDNFTTFMDKLAKVPNSEVRTALAREKSARKAQQRMFAGGGHLRLRRKDNLLLEVVNDALRADARRKVN